MNKKLVLSVLSTAVVASMASAAMAKPGAGFYVGADVDKYYSIDAFLGDHFDEALDNILDNMEATIFVDGDANAAPFLAALEADDISTVLKPATKADFENNPYAVVGGTEGQVYDPATDKDLPDGEPATGELKVDSAKPLNAKQFEVKFGTAVDKDTVIDADGNLVNAAFTKNGSALTGANPAELSADGKTLTITLAGAATWEGTYLFGVKKETVKSTEGKYIAEYNEKVSFTDSVAPTLVGSKSVNASTVKVEFSEPIEAYSSITAKLADGTDLTSKLTTPNLVGNSIELNLANADIPAGKEITVTFVGVVDFAGNLVEPNPVSVKVQKGSKDGVAPKVDAVTPINVKKFELKFSEEVEGFEIGHVKVNGTALVAPSKLTQDKTDKTKYVVEVNGTLSGLKTISIDANSFTDLSGEGNAAFSKVVNFPVDDVNPTLASASVIKKDGKEVLTLTFSEDVTLAASGAVNLPAVKVVDYVTSSTTLSFDADDLTPVTGSAKQFSIELSKITDNGGSLVKGATYTVNLVADLVTDTAGLNNEAKDAAFTFTREADANTTAPKVDTDYDASETGDLVPNNGIKVTSNNTLELKFNQPVDGASATNPANYLVSGAVVEKATLKPGNVVELTLAKDSNTYTGLRTVKVSGVKNKDGVVMEAHTTKEYLVENVRPTLAKIELTGLNELTLTFSESLDAATIEDGEADFDIYVGTTKYAGTVTEAAYSEAIKVTLGDDFTADDLTKGIKVKKSADFDVADENGNVANFTEVVLPK